LSLSNAPLPPSELAIRRIKKDSFPLIAGANNFLPFVKGQFSKIFRKCKSFLAIFTLRGEEYQENIDRKATCRLY
jgi:hypothetical protein